MKIAVYTCALNESKHVERWCNATKDADYRLVVDTGSTDNTVELLESYGVVVHQIALKPFRFDDARNAALNLLPEDIDICLSLDMDEIPEKGFFKSLKDIWEPSWTRAYLWWDTGSKWKNNNRLHHRFGYRWVKPCHEVTVKYSEGPEELVDIDLVVKPDKGFFQINILINNTIKGDFIHLTNSYSNKFISLDNCLSEDWSDQIGRAHV